VPGTRAAGCTVKGLQETSTWKTFDAITISQAAMLKSVEPISIYYNLLLGISRTHIRQSIETGLD
jgi:hypothetical protein